MSPNLARRTKMQGRPALLRTFTVANHQFTQWCWLVPVLRNPIQNPSFSITPSSKKQRTWNTGSRTEKQQPPVSDQYCASEAYKLTYQVGWSKTLFWMGRYARTVQKSASVLLRTFSKMNGVDPLPRKKVDGRYWKWISSNRLCRFITNANEKLITEPWDRISPHNCADGRRSWLTIKIYTCKPSTKHCGEHKRNALCLILAYYELRDSISHWDLRSSIYQRLTVQGARRSIDSLAQTCLAPLSPAW